MHNQEKRILQLTDEVYATKRALTSNLNEFKYDFSEQSEELTKKMEAIQQDLNLYEICKPEDEDEKDEGRHPDEKPEI